MIFTLMIVNIDAAEFCLHDAVDTPLVLGPLRGWG